ncbi:hypothetical protein BO71DRAFT_480244 [Aspergillus ellipticus CBS 707.79]|uniref:DASH complex subunit ASK1 n=1 Tax=Aspergillus ellipticus CBS 707.79 TaxID=1448320 RepID=A0A319DPH4_9EURO|nr:hypothetical protein BO71DRAFT_480244 [Aspergillus ellipticus CBS 707.79]
MSRPNSMSQRPLTLTEELEKLEQSITLTLQEIDHNFSQAHRIVTTSILPVVEQYAESSRDVWEGAKFWKQFFEASANVSLSGYEEKPTEDTTLQDQTATEEDPSSTSLAETETQSPSHRANTEGELTSLDLTSHSTPRAHDNYHNNNEDSIMTSPEPHFQHHHHNVDDDDFDIDIDADDDNDPYLPATPAKYSSSRHHHNEYNPDESHTPLSSSPFVPPPENPVLHQMADKTYRVQATPLGKGYQPASRSKFTATPKTNKSKYAFDNSPISSPEPEAPQLHAEIFSSPMKGITETPNTGRRRPSSHRARVTPQPGLSVLTPARGGGKRSAWDSDEDFDDGDEDLGPSPPKTMQFHIPQSRLMRTPAKEASKRIVEDLLFTAGANDTTDDLPEEQSPSVIQRVERLEDETF